MLESELFYSVTSLLAAILHLVIGVYVLVRSPRFTIAQAFFVTMLMGFFVNLMAFLTMTAADAALASMMTRFQMLFFTLMIGGYLYISSQLPYENFESPLWRYKFHYGAILIAVGIVGALLTGEVVGQNFGWMIGEVCLIYLLMVSVVFTAASVYLLYRTYASSSNPEAREECVLLALGIVFPIVYIGVLYMVEPYAAGALNLRGLAYIITVLIFAYGILRYKMFMINPVVEESLVVGDQPRTEEIDIVSPCVMIKERKPDLSYRLFKVELSRGAQGLVISRSHHDAIRQRYGLERTPIIWLANQPGHDRVEPENLSILEHMVIDFIRKSERAAIILDGLEFLISKNRVERVLKMLYSISDEAVLNGAKLIIPLDPNVMEGSEIALFEREFEVIEPPDSQEIINSDMD